MQHKRNQEPLIREDTLPALVASLPLAASQPQTERCTAFRRVHPVHLVPCPCPATAPWQARPLQAFSGPLHPLPPAPASSPVCTQQPRARLPGLPPAPAPTCARALARRRHLSFKHSLGGAVALQLGCNLRQVCLRLQPAQRVGRKRRRQHRMDSLLLPRRAGAWVGFLGHRHAGVGQRMGHARSGAGSGAAGAQRVAERLRALGALKHAGTRRALLLARGPALGLEQSHPIPPSASCPQAGMTAPSLRPLRAGPPLEASWRA